MYNSLIIVPYRDREDHLLTFLNYMHNGMHSHIPICIVEQSKDGKPFNRAKLLNIGYLENRPGINNIDYNTFIMHDVDMLPIGNVDYGPSPHYMSVTQLVKSYIQKIDYLGGVTKFTHKAFWRVGGYNNEYFHRAEDNEMMFNLKRLGIRVFNGDYNFKSLPHERKGLEFDPVLWVKAQQPRAFQNQLSICEYKVVDIALHGYDNVKHIVVDI